MCSNRAVLSVIVSTRHRPEHAAPCAEAILRCPAVSELIVVDQSDDTATREALSTIRDPRLRYLSSELRGCANGRNVGIATARGEILSFTDDDCRVAPDWTERVVTVFAGDPEAGAVCGRVSVPEALWEVGSSCSFEPRTPVWRGGLGDFGFGGNLSVRREVLRRVGPFDALLGVGAPLKSGEDLDLLFRVLGTGLKVVNAPEAVVEHLGIRPHGRDARSLWLSYAAGTGAAIFKHVRLGDPMAMRVCWQWLWSSVARSARHLLRSERPTGLGYVAAFVAGCVRSLRFGIDRRTRMYVLRHPGGSRAPSGVPTAPRS